MAEYCPECSGDWVVCDFCQHLKAVGRFDCWCEVHGKPVDRGDDACEDFSCFMLMKERANV